MRIVYLFILGALLGLGNITWAESFTEVLNKDLVGLDSDSQGARDQIAIDAKQFINYRKNPKSVDGIQLQENCLIQPTFSAFCPGVGPIQKPPMAITPQALRNKLFVTLLSLDKKATRPAKCKSAEPFLNAIYNDHNAANFHSRALYWLWSCAKSRGDIKRQADLKEQLWHKFPFDHHTLLALDADGDIRIQQLLEQNRDFTVAFRSSRHPEVNSCIAAVETLYQQHQASAAAYMTDHCVAKFTSSTLEPEVRLYLVTLTARIGAAKPSILPMWKVIYPLLLEHPEFISRQTLDLIYPVDLEVSTSPKSPKVKIFAFIQAATKADPRAEALDPYLIAALIHLESAFDPSAGSGSDAFGLTQLQLATAQSLQPGIIKSELLAPETSVRLGVKYLAQLLDQFKGNLSLSLAAYNSGPAVVEDWSHNGISVTEDPLIQTDLLLVNTENDYHVSQYVSSVLGAYAWYARLYKTP